jgi:hypothetical protein
LVIEVNRQHALAALREVVRQQGGHSGLADPALLVAQNKGLHGRASAQGRWGIARRAR